MECGCDAERAISLETAIRLPNALAGAATTLMLFAVVELLFGAPAAIAASALWALDVNATWHEDSETHLLHRVLSRLSTGGRSYRAIIDGHRLWHGVAAVARWSTGDGARRDAVADVRRHGTARSLERDGAVPICGRSGRRLLDRR